MMNGDALGSGQHGEGVVVVVVVVVTVAVVRLCGNVGQRSGDGCVRMRTSHKFGKV